MKKIYSISELKDKEPAHALVNDVDLVIVKDAEDISVLYGRCLHRGALMADGHIEGDNLICGVHGWDYRYDTGVSEYNNNEVLHKFTTHIDGDDLLIDEEEIRAFATQHPQPFNRDS
jgi:nitrite reductase/ring-hydroxylating ferredoxin subunit